MKNKLLLLQEIYILQSFFISIIFFLWSSLTGLLTFKILGIKLGKEVAFGSNFETFIFAIIIAPLFETFFFQFLLIYQTYESYKGKYQKQIAIFISSLLFGLSHFYNFYYFLFATIGGYLLANRFCYFKEKTNYYSAIFYIVISHSLSNFYIFLIKTFELL